MTTRNLDTGWTIGKRLVEVCGSFIPLTGAGTILATGVKGLGFGFAPVNGTMALRAQPGNNPTPKSTPGILRTGVGLYTVIPEDTYIDCNYFGADLAAPVAGSALWAQPVEPVANLNTAQTAPTCSVLIVNNAGAPTDAAANMRMYFCLQFRDSTVQFNKP
jgi:hypothetical protein